MNDKNTIIARLESQEEMVINHSKSMIQLIDATTSKFLNYAVLTKQCQHYTAPIELGNILQTRKCPICEAEINSSDDLVKSPTEWALTYFSENPNDLEKRKQCKTLKCCTIKGYYFHHYSRDKKFSDSLIEHDNLVETLIKNQNPQNNFINLCRNDPNIRNMPQGQLLSYKPICLLDYCKINIPVRHKDCKHHECYELSSLLLYAQEMQKGNVQNKKLRCLQDDCNVLFIMDINYLQTNLVLDYELLTALRQSPAYCLNLNLSTQTYKLENDFVRNNGMDVFIKEYFEKHQSEIQLSELQDQVLRSMTNLLQQNTTIQQIQIKNKYRIVKNISLTDKFTQFTVEYPARCVKCPLDKCCDLRTYLCFILTDNRQEKVKCPLCQNQFNCNKSQTNQFSKCFYVDFCLQKQLIKNDSHKTQNKFDYFGDQYLLEDFKKRSQTKDELIDIHKKANKTNIKYENLNCIKTNKRLQDPLRLPNCEQGNHISFKTLYQALEQNNFDFNQGLNFCQCTYCNTNQIFLKKNTLVYEPLFQDALEKLDLYYKQTNKILPTITYDILQCNLIVEGEKIQSKNSNNTHQQTPNQGVVIPVQDDDEYQEFFKEKRADNKYNYKILTMSQNFGSIQIDCNQKQVTNNIEQEKNRINQNLQNNDNYKKYNIQITGMQFQLGGIKRQFEG